MSIIAECIVVCISIYAPMQIGKLICMNSSLYLGTLGTSSSFQSALATLAVLPVYVGSFIDWPTFGHPAPRPSRMMNLRTSAPFPTVTDSQIPNGVCCSKD